MSPDPHWFVNPEQDLLIFTNVVAMQSVFHDSQLCKTCPNFLYIATDASHQDSLNYGCYMGNWIKISLWPPISKHILGKKCNYKDQIKDSCVVAHTACKNQDTLIEQSVILI